MMEHTEEVALRRHNMEEDTTLAAGDRRDGTTKQQAGRAAHPLHAVAPPLAASGAGAVGLALDSGREAQLTVGHRVTSHPRLQITSSKVAAQVLSVAGRAVVQGI